MRLIVVFVFLGVSMWAGAQEVPVKVYDFSNAAPVNKDSLLATIRKQRAYLDSIYFQLKVDSLELLYRHVAADTKGYNSFFLFGGRVSAAYDQLLRQLQANGFTELEEGVGVVGYGFSIKRKRFVHDGYFGIFTSSWMKGGNDERVKVAGGNALNYSIGFDLVGHPVFQLYAFAGASLRITSLQYERNGYINLPVSNPFVFAGSTSEFFVSKTDFVLNYGGEADIHVQLAERGSGVILGVRAGLMSPMATGQYKANGVVSGYKPDIKLSDSYLQIVLKFYTRGVPGFRWN
jgi:hypothetical protein